MARVTPQIMLTTAPNHERPWRMELERRSSHILSRQPTARLISWTVMYAYRWRSH